MNNRNFALCAAAAGCIAVVAGCASQTMTPRAAVPPASETPGVVDNGVYTRLQSRTPVATAAYREPAAPAAPERVAAPAEPPMLELGSLPRPAPVKTVAPGETYTVVSGDTLGHIARRHGIKVSQLAELNGLNPKTSILRVGQKLTLPAGVKPVSGKAAASAPAAKKVSETAQPAATVAAGGTYTVVKGDYPERIARRHGVSTKALLAANNLTERSVLQIGQKLVIPGKGQAAAPAAEKTPAPQPATTAAAEPAAPAVDVKIDIDALPLSDPSVSAPAPAGTEPAAAAAADIPTGLSAAPAAPVDEPKDAFVVDREQSLADFCLRYGVAPEVVRKHNPGVIQPGDMLKENAVILLPASSVR